MTPLEIEDELIDATVSAWRERDADGLPLPPNQWFDLPPEARVRAFHRQMEMRLLEAALDDRGWSGTVKAVMARLR